MKFLHRQVHRVSHPVRGLYFAAHHDAIQVHAVYGVLIALLTYLTWPVATLPMVTMIGTYTLLFITELVNTALEAALDKLHPEHDENIGRSKDIAAAAVLIAGLLSVINLLWLMIS